MRGPVQLRNVAELLQRGPALAAVGETVAVRGVAMREVVDLFGEEIPEAAQRFTLSDDAFSVTRYPTSVMYPGRAVELTGPAAESVRWLFHGFGTFSRPNAAGAQIVGAVKLLPDTGGTRLAIEVHDVSPAAGVHPAVA